MMTGSERAEYIKKVWLSCRTDDQRRNVENWIQRITRTPLEEDYRHVRGFIDEMYYIKADCGEPPKEEDYLKALNRSVKDLKNRVSKLEWRVKQ